MQFCRQTHDVIGIAPNQLRAFGAILAFKVFRLLVGGLVRSAGKCGNHSLVHHLASVSAFAVERSEVGSGVSCPGCKSLLATALYRSHRTLSETSVEIHTKKYKGIFRSPSPLAVHQQPPPSRLPSRLPIPASSALPPSLSIRAPVRPICHDASFRLARHPSTADPCRRGASKHTLAAPAPLEAHWHRRGGSYWYNADEAEKALHSHPRSQLARR